MNKCVFYTSLGKVHTKWCLHNRDLAVKCREMGMVAYTYTPSIWETEMQERCKLGVSLDYVRVVG